MMINKTAAGLDVQCVLNAVAAIEEIKRQVGAVAAEQACIVDRSNGIHNGSKLDHQSDLLR
jgi:hypothetical protein